MPSLLRQMIDARLGPLDTSAQRLLTLAAVVGQGVPFTIRAAVAGVDHTVLLEAVGAAVIAHIMVEAEDGSGTTFTHALIREALYEGTCPS